MALKRLGVAGVVAATIGAGVPAFFATAANAAGGPTTHLAISPSTQQGAAGTCILYTVTPLDAANGVPSDSPSQTIQLSATTSNPPTQQVSFCNPTPPFAQPGTASPSSGPFPPFTTTQTPATWAVTSTASPSNTTGAQTFGVRSNAPGTVTIRAWVDQPAGTTGQFDAGEPSGTATATITAGGTNNDDVSSGGNAAQDAVKTITEIPQSGSANPVAAGTGSGSRQFVTAQLKNASGDPVSGVTVNATFGSGSANGAQTSPVASAQPITCEGGSATTTGGVTTPPSSGPAGTATTGSQGGAVSNNVGTVTCYYTAVRSGADTIIVFVNQTGGSTSGPDASEPQLTVTRTTLGAPNANTAEARSIDLTPEGPIDTQSGASRTFTATVKDDKGTPVQGVNVQFTKSGAGTFAGASQTPTSATNAQGQTTVTIQSAAGETGQAVVTATITTGGTQCANAAGTPTGTTTTGNCSDSEVTNFTTATPTPSTTPGGRAALTLTVLTPTVPAGSTGQLRATGAANQGFQLECYSRPSTTFTPSHPGTFNAAGDPVTFTLALGRNTRCFIEYTTNPTQGASPSVVINVRTVLSLSTVRTGVRTYIFQGRNLPRVAGQLITLYRVDAAGNEIRTSNLVTDNTGIYRVTRHFTGTGTFLFRVRTSQTLNNAAGVSNTITVRVF